MHGCTLIVSENLEQIPGFEIHFLANLFLDWDIRDIPKEWIKRGQRNGEKLERTRICRNLSTISGQRRTSGSAQLDLLYHIKASILIVLVVANFDRYYDYNQIVQKSLVWGGNHVKSKLYRSKLGSRKLMYHVFKYILIQIS